LKEGKRTQNLSAVALLYLLPFSAEKRKKKKKRGGGRGKRKAVDELRSISADSLFRDISSFKRKGKEGEKGKREMVLDLGDVDRGVQASNRV